MKLVIRPRLQVETWSLYWKEPMRTDTQCLADVTITAEDDAPLQQVLQEVADKMGWPPVDKLLRLEGFTGDWERALHRGGALTPASTPKDLGLQDGDVVTYVRLELVAQGWKIAEPDGYSSDEDSLTDA